MYASILFMRLLIFETLMLPMYSLRKALSRITIKRNFSFWKKSSHLFHFYFLTFDFTDEKGTYLVNGWIKKSYTFLDFHNKNFLTIPLLTKLNFFFIHSLCMVSIRKRSHISWMVWFKRIVLILLLFLKAISFQ